MEKTVMKDLGTKEEFMDKVEKAALGHSLQEAMDKINFVNALCFEGGSCITLERFANYLDCMNLDITPEGLLGWFFKKKWIKRSKHNKVPYVTDYGWDLIHVVNDWKILPNGSMQLLSEVFITGDGQLEIVTQLLKEKHPKRFLYHGHEVVDLREVRESEKSKSDN
ncbi:hypothetical protein [Akkermansia sp. 54_46]|jgi:phage antirepressor YoqD-like protein|uniref:hypothetical protein n=1 Tax=Akkermansia sp. 54_46 TaxID=1896967 RepID=UPI00095EA6EC|nr:hypothetical protein [Akkermansia sp. 54_46]OLA90448.1 MAG: hypothetical protein BHW66_02860 [Akkermansia sp. 54_46]DAP09823.1 MAG TPA: hypothetical protein [Caudoviricetes sp.]